MSSQPLSSQEIDQLDAFLASDATPADTMALDTLHGFLTAIAVVSRAVPREEWLPLVWTEDGSSAPAFKDAAHESCITSLIERMLECIRVELDDPDYAFSPLVAFQTVGAKRYPNGEMWCYGFILATEYFSDDWESFLTSSEGRKLLHPIYLLGADEGGAADEALTKSPTQRAKLTGEISGAVDAIADHFLEERIRTTLTNAPASLPTATTVDTSTTSLPQQLCPCGSGRPFNECCGGARILH